MTKFLELCESPIEQRMGVALAFAQWPGAAATTGPVYGFVGPAVAAMSVLNQCAEDYVGGDWKSLPPAFFNSYSVSQRLEQIRHAVTIEPQAKVLKYRADFLVTTKLMILNECEDRLIIECDGHEFHSTPEQVAYDRARDLELGRAGYATIRFRGSEIYREPEWCASKVVTSLLSVHLNRRRAA